MLPSGLTDKIDDLMKADLLYWRGLWFGRLLLANAFVIGGLVLEYPELRYDMRSVDRNRIRFLRYRIVILERRLELAKVIAFVGWILIVVGVAGEMITEAVVFDADRNIEAFDGAVLAETQRSANSAAMAASLANTFADKAIKKAGH